MLNVLDLFNEGRRRIRYEDVVDAEGCSRATAYRYLRNLCNAGLLAPATDSTFILGSRILELERLLRLADPLMACARPIVKRVSETMGLNMLLCSYFRDRVMCADIAWPDTSVAPSYERGRPMPMFHGAMAKIILAYLSPYQLRNLVLWHQKEIRQAGLGDDWKEFRAHMGKLRRVGSCVTNAEVIAGLVGIGAPIFDPDKRILGSVVFAVPEKRVRQLGEDYLRESIVQVAQEICDAIAAAATAAAAGAIVPASLQVGAIPPAKAARKGAAKKVPATRVGK